jgi:hypothetical protein
MTLRLDLVYKEKLEIDNAMMNLRVVLDENNTGQ